MKRLMLFVIFFIYVSIDFVNCKNCNTLGIALYESMGCVAKYEDGNCPTEYDCKLPEDDKTCFYQGEFFKEGEKLFPADAPCNGECTCRIIEGKPRFSCGSPGCHSPKVVEEGCYKLYEPGNCCSIGIKCHGKDKIKKCNVGGVEFEEGTGIRPNDTCTYCSCTKSGPKCSYDACPAWAQLYHQHEIKAFCAPVYLKDSQRNELLCCPNTFVCPDGTEEIHKNSEKISEGRKCKFGNLSLDIGDHFNSTLDFFNVVRYPIKCECLVPPLITCYETVE